MFVKSDKVVKNEKSKLEALQMENNLRFLVLQCIIKWGILFRCMESIYKSMDVLYIIERA